MGLVDVQAAMPFIIFAILVIAFFGNDLTVLFVLLVGFHGWERYARLVRGLIIDANTQGYAHAARCAGDQAVADLPAADPSERGGAIVVQFSLNLPETILLEAGLSALWPRRAAAADQPRPLCSTTRGPTSPSTGGFRRCRVRRSS